MTRERSDSELNNLIARLAITVFGIFLTVFLVRNWDEAKARYAELEALSPLVAWAVKWSAIVVFLITASTIAMLIYMVYRIAVGEL